MRIIPSLLTRSLAVMTIALPLAGCSGAVAEFQILKSYVKSPAVEYANQDAWSCDLAKSTITKGVVEDCGACRNVSGLS